MAYAVSLEQVESQWVAFVTALPGCFVAAPSRDAALAAAPQAIIEYIRWRRSKGDSIAMPQAPVAVVVDEIMREWANPLHPNYTVSAFLASDAPPLTQAEITLGLRVLAWSYTDLLAAAEVPEPAFSQAVEGEWSIAGILDHCGRAERWYLDRLGLAPERLPKSAGWRARLESAHRVLLEVLPTLAGVPRLEFVNGELWSPRKMLRRAIWHERDHTLHIRQFRARLSV